MAQKQKRKLRYKYRVSIINEDTFEEVWRSRLSRFNLMAMMFFYAVLVVTITIMAVFFTPLKEYIPGYPTRETSNAIIQNYMLTDSLILELDKQKRFYSALHSIVSGDIPEDWLANEAINDTTDTEHHYLDQVNLDPSYADSMFRIQYEEEERYNLSILDQLNNTQKEDELLMVAPLKGVLTGTFDPSQGHFGVDIVAGEKEKIMSIAEGTVTLAEWTIDAGYVIQIQHAQNLISIYKHNDLLLKKAGDQVKAGEVIATMGNTGELSHGAHLHIELWQDGKPLDPKQHIIF